MNSEIHPSTSDFNDSFKVFHDLMQRKVRNILLVSSLYDACIMEEDARLAERIINEYRGLNLSQPPRLSWVSKAEEALIYLDKKEFDLLITMPRLADMDPSALGCQAKKHKPDLPVILLTHSAAAPARAQPVGRRPEGIDRVFVWTGNSDLLLAQIKSVEDGWNVRHDTQSAKVRVILFVEDSPLYLSSILPILYREVVTQTQAVMEEKLNEEDRLLTMRARSKILIAQTFEEAMMLYKEFKPFLLGIISDVRLPRAGQLDEDAGVELLTRIREEVPDIPVLLTSSESSNREKAARIPATFIDKNSQTLHAQIRDFFLEQLGFGDFVFRMPDQREVARVSTVRGLEKTLPSIPLESFIYHANRNDFSRWLFARTETQLAIRMRPVSFDDFAGDVEKTRSYFLENLIARRKKRQKGVLVDFEAADFDPDTDFLKIGKGSLGGKARGLIFISALLQRHQEIYRKFPDVELMIPRTLVITTEDFDLFTKVNNLSELSKSMAPDDMIAERFLRAPFPERLAADLRAYLAQVKYPLAVRSSGLLEDAQFMAYAGLYRTYMIPNNHPDLEIRLEQLIRAIKLVYASTYFHGPKSFARRLGQRTEEEKMAVIVQELVGGLYNGHYYPAVSGVAQSRNYYPFARQKPEDGVAVIALGLGKTVMEGGKTLRFSPRHPQLLPQFSTVDDRLKNAQTSFYALNMGQPPKELGLSEDSALIQREIHTAADEFPVKLLAGTYIAEEHRIKDFAAPGGHPVLTFAHVLKHKNFPLPDLLDYALDLLHEGMGCPVETEFSVHLRPESGQKSRFAFLQVRPMTARMELMEVDITKDDIAGAFCYSGQALGNTENEQLTDIVYVEPEAFDPARTQAIAGEIGRFNAELMQADRRYLLIGPGRWGSADRWLGIPVQWSDISAVGAIVETTHPELKAEPSQGSHFFHNVTTLGINYLTLANERTDFIKWEYLTGQQPFGRTRHVVHLRLKAPVLLKIDGRCSQGIIRPPA